MTRTPRWPVELAPQECLRLLGSVPMGRLMFTARALPAIRPAFHVVDGDYVVVRSDPGAPAVVGTRPGGGPVLAYQADAIDPLSRLGWSVVVIGAAHQVADPGLASSYRTALAPGITGPGDQVIAIHTDLITGFRLTAAAAPSAGSRQKGRSPCPAPTPPSGTS